MHPSLEYFLCIAKHNNITRAAEELHITQQSLSSYLKRLEEYYELPLFTRKSTMALTPFGQSVYDRARIISAVHDEIDAMRIYNHASESVKVGFTIIHVYQAMQLLDIHRFKAMHRDICLQFRHSTLQTLSSLLDQRELDIYFASYIHAPKMPTPDMEPTHDFVEKEVGKFDFKAIINEQLLRDYFGHESDALIEKWRTGVTLKELSCVPLILLKQLRTPIFLDSKEQGYSIQLFADSDNIHLIMEMVAERLGFSIVPSLTNFPHSSFIQFPIHAPESLKSQSIFCCTTKSALERGVVRDLWDMVSPLEQSALPYTYIT